MKLTHSQQTIPLFTSKLWNLTEYRQMPSPQHTDNFQRLAHLTTPHSPYQELPHNTSCLTIILDFTYTTPHSLPRIPHHTTPHTSRYPLTSQRLIPHE